MTKELSQMQLALDIIPVSKWSNYFVYPTTGAIRQWIFRDTNNFNNVVIRKVGARKCIKISALSQWIEDTNK